MFDSNQNLQAQLKKTQQELSAAQERVSVLEVKLTEATSVCQSMAYQHSFSERFQKLIESSSSHIVLTDEHGEFNYSNSVEHILGYSIDEYAALKPQAIIHPDDFAHSQRVLQRLRFAPNATETIIVRNRHKQGHYVWVESTITNLLQEPSIGAIVAKSRDISERKQAEALLERSETLFRSTFEQAAVGIAHTDMDGRWLRVNQRLCEIVGYRAEEMYATSFQAITHPADLAEDLNLSKQLLNGELQTYSMHKRYIHKCGNIVWVNLTVSLVRYVDQSPDFFAVVVEDITQLKQVEFALKQSEERYRRVVEEQTDLVCRCDPNFQLTFVNYAYSSTFGKSPAQMIGQSLLNDVPADYHAVVVANFAALSASKPGETYENPVFLGDGSQCWVQWSNRKIVDENGQVVEYQSVGRDITTRKLAEEQERAQRLFAEAMRDSLAALTTSLDVDSVMQKILDYALKVVACEAGSILLFEGDQGHIAYTRGFAPESVAFFKDFRFSMKMMTYGNLLANKQPYIVHDTDTTEGWVKVPTTQWIRSSVGVPIALRGELIGTLSIDSATPNYFQQEAIEKLQAFARYASLALENAYHVAHLEERVAERSAEMQSAKERVEAILNNSLDGILLIHPNLSIEQANVAFYTLFRIEPNDNRNLSLLNIIASDDVERVNRIFHTVLSEQVGKRFELHAIRSDKTIFDAELGIGNIKDNGLVCTIRDISEQKLAEKTLQKYATEVHDLYNSAPCGYHSLDQDGFFVQINDTELRWLGYRREEVIGVMKLSDCLTTKSLEVFKIDFPLLKKRGWIKDLELDLVCKDGSSIKVLTNTIAVFDENGQYQTSRSTLYDISELKVAQNAIRKSEALYRLLAENITDSIIRISATGLLQYISPSSQSVLGYAAEELLGKLGHSLVYHADLILLTKTLENAIQNQTASPLVVMRVRHKDNHYVWLESRIHVIRSEETGEVVEFIASARDITERKRAENALLESEARYRLLADHITDWVTRVDVAGRYLYVSPSTRAVLGYEPEDLIGRLAYHLIHPDDIAWIQESHKEVLDLRRPPSLVTSRLRHKDGHYIWLEATTRAIYSEKTGKVIEFISSSRNVSERKRVENALLEQRDFLQQVINNVPDLISVKDRNGRFQLVNERTAQVYGYTPAQMIGKSDAEVNCNSAEVANFVEQDKAVLESEQPLFIPEETFGQRIFQTSIIPLKSVIGRVERLLIVGNDITERKQAEIALEQALAKERELGELKSRFVSMASHEFRTPLAVIRATADTLRVYRHKLPDDQIEKRLGKIQTQVEALKEIIEDVLQLSRLQANRADLTPALLDIDLFCRTIIDELGSDVGIQQQVIYQCDETLRQVAIDKKLLRHIISNIIANAIKYSASDKPIFVSLSKTEQTIILQVRDQGIGIPEADLKHLFQPFHRAANVENIAGTGLGLAITNESVKLLDGTIAVKSQVGVGTTVTVSIPRHPKGEKDSGKDSNH